MEPKITLSRTVCLPVGAVWRLVTATRKFHSLRIPGLYSSLDTSFAEVGSTFKYRSLFGGDVYKRYVVEWKPPSLFAFGHSPSEWSFRWQLASQSQETKVIFTRVFRKLSLWERLFKEQEVFDSYRHLAGVTMNILHEACETLATDGKDGLRESPWNEEL